MSNNYKLVGVMKFLNIYPNFVRLVFEKDGKYYYQKGDNGIIMEFKEVDENICSKVTFLCDVELNIKGNIKEEYNIGDEVIIGFQLKKNSFVLGDINGFTTFIEMFMTEDDILKEEIEIFLDAVRVKNMKSKVRIKEYIV